MELVPGLGWRVRRSSARSAIIRLRSGVSARSGRRAEEEVCGGETGLEEFGDDAAAGDEVDHGDGQVAFGVEIGGVPDLGRVLDEAFSEAEGERGDLVDDEEGIADDCGLDGGGAAGDDAGAGVVEGFAGVGDEVDGFAVLRLRVGGDEVIDPVGFQGGGYGDEVFVVAA